jgi:hypothetical protein
MGEAGEMMNVNLIPANRLRVRQTRRHIRWWSVGGSIYIMILASIGLVAAGSTFAGGDLEVKIVQATAETESNKQKETQIIAALRVLQNELAAAQYIAERPDWSVLLAEVATMRGDDVVLHEMSLLPDSLVNQDGDPIRRARTDFERRFQMNGPGSLVVVNDEALVDAIESAKRRLVVVAPALSKLVATCLARRWHELGKDAVVVVVDTSADVFRLGYGDVELLTLLEKTGQEVGG